MRFKGRELHCSLHFSSQTDTSVRLDFMVFHFLWQVKYWSCDELAEKKKKKKTTCIWKRFKLRSTRLKSEIVCTWLEVHVGTCLLLENRSVSQFRLLFALWIDCAPRPPTAPYSCLQASLTVCAPKTTAKSRSAPWNQFHQPAHGTDDQCRCASVCGDLDRTAGWFNQRSRPFEMR